MPARRRPHPAWWVGSAFVLVLAVLVALAVRRFADDDSRRNYLSDRGWPSRGQAAYSIGADTPVVGPDQHVAPIASVAKVMTAYLVLHAAPLHDASSGFRMTVTSADVADTARREARDESLVHVAAGEVLTERQALAALLLPSANNVAVMLARHVAGSVRAFVALMNATAARLGMVHTTYTDPSGYEASTVSTAADQLLLASAAVRNRTLTSIAALRSYPLPVAGTVHNTDTLLGTRGFVGLKTGSMDASGGCFMFRSVRVIDGARVPITGVVLGQHGHDLIRASLYAAAQLTDRISSGHAPRGTRVPA